MNYELKKGLVLSERRESKGFTLIELLVVIGILAVLLAITLIAINPARQFSQANNTTRQSDVTTILNAVTQYATDNKGTLPAGIDTTVRAISNDETIVNRVDLCSSVVTQYIAALPVDPLTANGTAVTDCIATYNTNYTIVQSATNNRLTVTAPAAELGVTVAVTR